MISNYSEFDGIEINNDPKLRSITTMIICVEYENSYAFLDINLFDIRCQSRTEIRIQMM